MTASTFGKVEVSSYDWHQSELKVKVICCLDVSNSVTESLWDSYSKANYALFPIISLGYDVQDTPVEFFSKAITRSCFSIP